MVLKILVLLLDDVSWCGLLRLSWYIVGDPRFVDQMNEWMNE